MKDIKKQLCQKYPFMEKKGEIYSSFNKQEVLEKYRNEKLLILMVGVQGSGKTTYCKKNFSEYTIINLDEMLVDYLQKNKGPYTWEVNEKLNQNFLEMIEHRLKHENIVVVDAGSLNMPFRIMELEYLQGKYTKVILIVLNPSKEVIASQIRRQLFLRNRPGLWNDVHEEIEFLKLQLENHYIEMGVDEVYIV